MLIPEVNLGQLLLLIRAKYLIDAVGYDKVRGKPFRIAEIVTKPSASGPRRRASPADPATTAPTRPAGETDMTDTNGHATGARPRPAAAEPRERGASSS